jgi:hypothetical protein
MKVNAFFGKFKNPHDELVEQGLLSMCNLVFK